jgi:alpha-tubulin suppressor-like RCC1 family protein
MKHDLKQLFICISIALLASCGSQDSKNTDLAEVNTAPTATKTVANAQQKDNKTSLLVSLEANYPNGQLPANRVAQASADLVQNPAALKLTAETAPWSNAQSATASSSVDAMAVATDYQPVQRVQNTTLFGAYFFSIYPTEITAALASNPQWVVEGPAFWASLAAGTDLSPVHRFRNLNNGRYLYTIYDSERASIVANYSTTFVYEGIAWYARQTQAPGWSALFRFRNKTNGTYLFTAYESEKDAIVANYSSIFALEGIAYYVRQDAQADPLVPVVSLQGATRVVSNTLYTYSASLLNASASAWLWFWGDGSADSAPSSANSTSKVWYKPGSYNASVLVATINGGLATATQSVTVVGKPIATGGGHSCSLKNDGGVSCWGRNLEGQLGDGTLASKSIPSSVQGLTGVTAIATGVSHNCALKNDGRVSCWGDNNYGQLGDGTVTSKSSPTTVSGLTEVIAITTSGGNSCALKNDGRVSCWGGNFFGQLGDGTLSDKVSPTAVPGLTGVVAIATGGNYTCSLKNEGSVSCWGGNFYGQLGDGTISDKLIPTAVQSLSGVVAIDTGLFHGCALKNNGSVNCWGDNGLGQLGDGTLTSKTSPTTVLGLTRVVAITTGYYHNCALKNDGTVSCWGRNNSSQLGDGTTVNKTNPVAVTGLTGVVAIAANYSHTCALKNDGRVSCWGDNSFGQLGDGTIANKISPTDVLGGVVFWK